MSSHHHRRRQSDVSEGLIEKNGKEKGKLGKGGEILIIATWHNKKRNFSSPPQLKIELSPSKGEIISVFHFPSLRSSSFFVVVGSRVTQYDFYLLNVECWRNFESGLDITKFFFLLEVPKWRQSAELSTHLSHHQLELGKNTTYLTERLKATDNRAREVREKKEKKTLYATMTTTSFSLWLARDYELENEKRKKKQNLTATSHHARETTPESIMKIYTLLLELEPELIFAIA